MAPARTGDLLARVNFPLYTINTLTERHILVAGGGGKSKTGIPNKIEIYELLLSGSTCRAEPVTRYETGGNAIMNCTVFHNGKHFVLAAGTDEHCQVYQLKYCILGEEETSDCNNFKEKRKNSESLASSQTSIRRRRRTNSLSANEDSPEAEDSATHKGGGDPSEDQTKRKPSDNNANNIPVRIGFNIQPEQSFQTDFCSKDDPLQKVVRYVPGYGLLLTGGVDGFLRAWKYPQFVMEYEVKAHEDDVDDIAVSPLENKMVSVSRDGHGYVWETKTGKRVCELQYSLPKNNEKYVFRGCRFGIVEGDKKNNRLFTILNPVVRKKPPLPSYLVKWDTVKFLPEKVVSTGSDMLSSIAVSEDGKFVGVGTLTGTVEVYIAFSLQRLYRAERSHSIFVTGLDFLKSCDETRRLSGNHEASLISISVDNHIVAHHIPFPATMGITGLVIMFFCVLLSVYLIMDYLQL